MVGLEGILRKLGGGKEGFVETVLLPQMHSALDRFYTGFEGSSSSRPSKPPKLPKFQEGFECSLGNDVIAKMFGHCNTQSSTNGKSVLKELKKATVALPAVASDVVSLQKKIAALRRNMEASSLLTTRVVNALRYEEEDEVEDEQEEEQEEEEDDEEEEEA